MGQMQHTEAESKPSGRVAPDHRVLGERRGEAVDDRSPDPELRRRLGHRQAAGCVRHEVQQA